MPSGNSCAAKGAGFSRSLGAYLVPACHRRGCRLVFECGLGVGRSAKAETYVTTLGIEFRGIEADAHKYILHSNFLHLNSIEAQSFD